MRQLEFIESKISHSLLKARWDDFINAKKELANYTAFLETCHINEDTREQFRKLQEEYISAKLNYEASLPTLKIHALADVVVKVSEQTFPLYRGGTKELKDLESPINIDDKTEITVKTSSLNTRNYKNEIKPNNVWKIF